MPEEKKEKKSIFPIFGSSTKEEKKDSFTFSDKIKNSKTAASPSFANRISSKIGSNGRPKKTLFERTKRDAPFFIAALVALLLLPFLYKYSGQVNEEPVIAPSSEETAFDPERYGFDTAVTDPDGQIAQLSARDPLSLIKGFGSGEEDSSSAEDSMEEYDRSGLGDTSSGSSYSSTGPSTETTTNIYRRKAAPATRAAFRRSATKIKEMGRAPMASAGGGLNVTPWGGSLKGAAKKVRASGPRTAPKPVSLQPLQAAGKPSRGYFGMGNAELARRSKEALSKGNAMQALRDAQFAPINPGRIGGLSGSSDRHGGGASDLKHGFGFNSITPWWWDLMKTRSQMEWEKKFNRKWNWIEWGDKLAQNILGGVINCLLTGEDDGAMGEMFGASGSDAQDAGCKCNKGLYKTAEEMKKAAPEVVILGQFKKWCQNEKGGGALGCKWQDAKAQGGGFLKTRADCLGVNLFGKAGLKGAMTNADITSANGDGKAACKDFEINKVYSMKLSGNYSKWNAYHFVVARNNSPFANRNLRLCGFDSSRQYTKATSTGAEYVGPQVSLEEGYRLLSVAKGQLKYLESQAKQKNGAKTVKVEGKTYTARALKKEIDVLNHSLEKARKEGGALVGNNFARRSQQNGRVQGRYSYEDINSNAGDNGNNVDKDPEINYHDCVIYIAAGQEFEYRKFKEETILVLAQMLGSKANTFYELEKDPGYGEAYAQAKEAFGRLDLRYIRGLITKQPLAITGKPSNNNAKLPAMPMVYFDFDRSYIQRRSGRSAGNEKTNDKVFKRKERQDNAFELVTPCVFTDLAILGKKVQNNSPEATLTIPATKKFEEYDVSGVINYEVDGQVIPVKVDPQFIEPIASTAKENGANRLQDYRIKDARAVLKKEYPAAFDEQGKLKPGFDLSGADGKVRAVVNWKAVERSSQRTAADEVPVANDKVEPTPNPVPVINVQEGGELANYSCNNTAKFSTFAANKKPSFQTINEAYKDNPIWCKECQVKAKEVLKTVIAESKKVIAANEASRTKLNEANVPPSDPKFAELNNSNKKAEQVIATAERILDQEKTKGKWWLTIHDYLIVLDYMSKKPGDVNTVPVASVCYLARSIAQMSADPQVPQRADLNNVFGTFAVYVGPDSYLFPMQTVKVNGRTCMDPRFTGVDKSSDCVKRTLNTKKTLGTVSQIDGQYHWGYYDHSFWDSGDVQGTNDTEYYPYGFRGYTDALAARGIGKDGYYPLSDMKRDYTQRENALSLPPGRLSSHGQQNADRENASQKISGYNTWSGGKADSSGGTRKWRNDYHKVYNKPFYDTNGCDEYKERMNVSNVLRYLDLVCENGLNYKPETGYAATDGSVDKRNYGTDSNQGESGQEVAK